MGGKTEASCPICKADEKFFILALVTIFFLGLVFWSLGTDSALSSPETENYYECSNDFPLSKPSTYLIIGDCPSDQILSSWANWLFRTAEKNSILEKLMAYDSTYLKDLITTAPDGTCIELDVFVDDKSIYHIDNTIRPKVNGCVPIGPGSPEKEPAERYHGKHDIESDTRKGYMELSAYLDPPQ